MSIKLANNAVTNLSAPMLSTDTTLSVTTGTGAKFPTLGVGDTHPLTLIRASDNAVEIMTATARSVDTFTVTRAQEGTTALAFVAGDRVELRMTAGTFGSLPADQIHNSTAKATPVDADEIRMLDSGASYVSKKFTWANLRTTLFGLLGSMLNTAPSKATPVDADSIFIQDSTATNATTQLTLANLKAYIWAAFGALIGAGTTKATPVGADALAIMDSAAGNATKNLTFTNLVAYLNSSLTFPTTNTPPSGTMLMWPSPTAPSWALVRNGSAIARSSYANLFSVLCPTRSGTTSSGSNLITGLSSTADLYVGMPVEGSGIPAGATISGISSASSITVSANATASGTVPITLFYYGYGVGGNSTTFGVPDDRGAFERGLDTGAAARDTLNYSCTNTSGTNVISGLSSTLGMSVGMAVSGTGVPGGATIASITSTTAITISANTTQAVTSITVTGNRIGNYSVESVGPHSHTVPIGLSTLYTPSTSGSNVVSAQGIFSAQATATSNGTGAETRPKNRAYLPIIVF